MSYTPLKWHLDKLAPTHPLTVVRYIRWAVILEMVRSSKDHLSAARVVLVVVAVIPIPSAGLSGLLSHRSGLPPCCIQDSFRQPPLKGMLLLRQFCGEAILRAYYRVEHWVLLLRVMHKKNETSHVAKRLKCTTDANIIAAQRELKMMLASQGKSTHIVKLEECIMLPSEQVFIMECAFPPTSPSCKN